MQNSIFRYIFTGRNDLLKTSERIEDELNRGNSFIVSPKRETVVSLGGPAKNWVKCVLKDRGFSIYVDDRFFVKESTIAQILTSLWLNLFDFGKIRLESFQLSERLHKRLIFVQPAKSLVQKLRQKNKPCFGTIFKPSFNLSLKDKINIAKKMATLGATFVKEDETYLIDRVKLIKESEKIQQSMRLVSNDCYYVPNITSYLTDNDIFRDLYGIGVRVAMVNYLIAGLPNVYNLQEKSYNILLWGHRVGYKSIQKYISMQALASVAVYSGMNLVHIGTPFIEVNTELNASNRIYSAIKQINKDVIQVFTKVSSQIVPSLIKTFGPHITLMACGSIRTKGELDWQKVENLIKSF